MARENLVEWVQGDDKVTATFQNNRYQAKIRRIAEERPDEVRIMAENQAGRILVQFPLRWVKITPSRILTEEQKAILSERGKRLMAAKYGTNDDNDTD